MGNSKRILSVATALLLGLPLAAPAQWEKKPNTEWSEREAMKVLNDSPWGRTQAFSSPVTLFRGPTSGRQGISQPTTSIPANATHINFRIRFFSAKPVRQAIVRLLELRQKQEMSDELTAHLNSLASGDFQQYIIVTVSCDAQEAGANVQEAAALLRSRGTADLKNNTFLEIKGGKRLFLQEYQQPRPDGLGARFIFPRLVDGKPFITPESEEVRFFSELNGTYRLDRRYKIKDMIYEGKLEY
ncbi:MAG TPA: hypothetical protein VNN73_06880 [Blastocatellia bacterium]|nr:hypothetical protein [Blastocatellia bacterium]